MGFACGGELDWADGWVLSQEVTADGEKCVAEPAAVLPLAQKWSVA